MSKPSPQDVDSMTPEELDQAVVKYVFEMEILGSDKNGIEYMGTPDGGYIWIHHNFATLDAGMFDVIYAMCNPTTGRYFDFTINYYHHLDFWIAHFIDDSIGIPDDSRDYMADGYSAPLATSRAALKAVLSVYHK